MVLAAPAAVAVWSGWVRLGQMTGFGLVRPFPGLWDSLRVNTAITLPIGVEAGAAGIVGKRGRDPAAELSPELGRDTTPPSERATRGRLRASSRGRRRAHTRARQTECPMAARSGAAACPFAEADRCIGVYPHRRMRSRTGSRRGSRRGARLRGRTRAWPQARACCRRTRRGVRTGARARGLP